MALPAAGLLLIVGGSIYGLLRWDLVRKPLCADYFLTWLSVIANTGVCLRYLYRRRRTPSLSPFHVYGRSLRFYWPVYTWGLDAIRSFFIRLFRNHPAGGLRPTELIMFGWGATVAGAVSVSVVVLFAALVQLAFVRVLPSASHGAVGIPFPIVYTILGILGIESWILTLGMYCP